MHGLILAVSIPSTRKLKAGLLPQLSGTGGNSPAETYPEKLANFMLMSRRAREALSDHLKQCSSLSKLNKAYLCSRNPYLLHPENRMPWQIVPGLYLGTGIHAATPQVLKQLGITTIVNATIELVNYFEPDRDMVGELMEAANKSVNLAMVLAAEDINKRSQEIQEWIHETELQHIEYLQVPLRDDENENLLRHISDAYAFMKRFKSQNSIMVHCNAGISRSAAIICAFLMMDMKYSLDKALEMVKSARSQASPNPGFLKQLKVLEVMLHNNVSPDQHDKTETHAIK